MSDNPASQLPEMAQPLEGYIRLNGAWHKIENTIATEDTLFKVRDTMLKFGLGEGAVNILINELQNAGILFRERMVDYRG